MIIYLKSVGKSHRNFIHAITLHSATPTEEKIMLLPFPAGFLFGSCSDSEYGYIFPRNFRLSLNYTALQPMRPYSSVKHCISSSCEQWQMPLPVLQCNQGQKIIQMTSDMMSLLFRTAGVLKLCDTATPSPYSQLSRSARREVLHMSQAPIRV
jgi:hypothetical protein